MTLYEIPITIGVDLWCVLAKMSENWWGGYEILIYYVCVELGKIWYIHVPTLIY